MNKSNFLRILYFYRFNYLVDSGFVRLSSGTTIKTLLKQRYQECTLYRGKVLFTSRR
jgi:hypothetical protein